MQLKQYYLLSQLVFPFPNTKWQGTTCGISIAFNIDHYLFFCNAHPSGGGINNTHIGLMRHQPRNIFWLEPVFSAL